METVVDANVHLREPGGPASAVWADDWPAGTHLTAEDYRRLMARASVTHGVLVTGIRTDGFDNSLTFSSAARHPDVFATVGNFDVFDPLLATRLRSAVVEHGMAGARLYGGDAELADEWLHSAAAAAAWATASELGISLSAQRTRLSTFPALRERMRASPEVPVVVHASAGIGPGSPEIPELLRLAGSPPAHVVLSVGDLYRAGRDATELLRALVGAFGAERVMWGSYSQFRGARGGESAPTLEDLVRWTTESLSFLDGAGRRAVIGGTGAALYHLARH